MTTAGQKMCQKMHKNSIKIPAQLMNSIKRKTGVSIFEIGMQKKNGEFDN